VIWNCWIQTFSFVVII